VLVRGRSRRYLPLDPNRPIPLGSTIDVKDGVVDLAAIVRKGGKVDHVLFSEGIFKVTQTRTTTDLTLVETLAPRGKKARAAGKQYLAEPKRR
jgi:hypothetical protein